MSNEPLDVIGHRTLSQSTVSRAIAAFEQPPCPTLVDAHGSPDWCEDPACCCLPTDPAPCGGDVRIVRWVLRISPDVDATGRAVLCLRGACSRCGSGRNDSLDLELPRIVG